MMNPDLKIGLALGGGAARGLAHIPMLEVLDEMNIRVHRVAGTSMGALVGAAYAAGIPAKELRAHVLDVLGDRIGAARRLLGGGLELFSFKGFGQALINGEVLTRMILPAGVPSDIETLPTVFSVSATDFYGAREVILSSGPLVQAVAASIAIPGVIAGPELEGRLLVDGGVINPLPVDHLHQDCDFTIAVDVTGKPFAGQKGPSSTELMLGAVQIFTRQIIALRNAQDAPNVYIEPQVGHFRAHDFLKVREILEIGDRSKDEFRRMLELSLTKAMA